MKNANNLKLDLYPLSTISNPLSEFYVLEAIRRDLYSDKDIKGVLCYCFANITEESVAELFNHAFAKEKINQFENDEQIFGEIFHWYLEASKHNFRGFDESYEKYVDAKSKIVADIVERSSLEARDNKKLDMLDIGTGNGALAYFISQNLEANLTTIDLAEDCSEKWGSTSEHEL